MDERNQAGEELLEFSSANQLSVMSTWFQKKSFKFGTWMHPANKQLHQIDLVLVRSREREICINVQVMRGANCWSDHKMVRVKLRLGLSRFSNKKVSSPPLAVYKLSSQDKRDQYGAALGCLLDDHLTVLINLLSVIGRPSVLVSSQQPKRQLVVREGSSLSGSQRIKISWYL